MSRARPAKDAGFALIVVMVLGAVAMYAAASLIGHGGVAERRLQEQELLKLRAYWAAQGHIAYAVSRARQGPACGGTCQNFAMRRQAFDAYVGELNEDGGQRDWSYPELGAGYVFPVEGQGKSQQALMDVQISFPAAATAHPLIVAEWPVRGDFRAFVCNGAATEGVACPTSQNDLDEASVFTHLVRMEPR